ncbi:hypothetical protein [Streptomyces sioyaensis]|uniref:hypothetical protein n=1 Tax=Streptomyces sioyaensis TaxID=67364 RepID=UPI00378E53D5
MKIASFAAQGPIPNWTDHLALWAQLRESQPGRLPLDACVVDLHAPELETETLAGMAGLAKIAGISADDLPAPKYGGRNELPEAQYEVAGSMRWAVPVGQDWAEMALLNRTWHRPKSPYSAPCGLRRKSAASSIRVSLRRRP